MSRHSYVLYLNISTAQNSESICFSYVFRLVLKYAQIVLAQHHKLLCSTKITFYEQVYLPLLLNQKPKPKVGCGCLPFSSISAHLSLHPLLLANRNIYKQVWICEKL